MKSGSAGLLKIKCSMVGVDRCVLCSEENFANAVDCHMPLPVFDWLTASDQKLEAGY